MPEIVKLIDKYLILQKSVFQENETMYFFEDFNNTSIEDMNKYYIRGFCVILSFQKHALVISNHCHNNNFKSFMNLQSIMPEAVLHSFTLLVGAEVIPFWSENLSQLIEMLRLHNVKVESIESDGRYDIVHPHVELEDKRFDSFKGYISFFNHLGHTKDSDFILKDTFNYFDGESTSNQKDKTLAFYLERKYTDFLYGYLNLDFTMASQAETIFNFWFKDLFLTHSDIGIGHLHYSCFYFVIACKSGDRTKIEFEKLVSKHKIVLLEYSKGPVCFVNEFMHYKSEISFLNRYFLGIYNNEDWVLFDEVFQKIVHKIHYDICEAEITINIRDSLTAEEKHNLRFAYLMYNLLSDIRGAAKRNRIPWFALPSALFAFKRTKEFY